MSYHGTHRLPVSAQHRGRELAQGNNAHDTCMDRKSVSAEEYDRHRRKIIKKTTGNNQHGRLNNVPNKYANNEREPGTF